VRCVIFVQLEFVEYMPITLMTIRLNY